MSAHTADDWLEDCLSAAAQARVAVFGDFCLDCYWLIDTDLSDLSVETNRPVWRVRRQRYSLGGAGNVAANLADLGAAEVFAVGLVGDDMFGRQLLDLLNQRGVNTHAMLNCQADWQTLAYAKPCIGEIEQHRLDYGAFNVIGDDAVDQLADHLSRVAGQADVVILNQQVSAGVSTPAMIERINAVIADHRDCRFIVDSRDRAKLYHGAMLKLNAHEASDLLGEPRPLDEPIGATASADLARRLAAAIGQAVFITRGDDGIVAADDRQVHGTPGIEVLEQTDTVGAGDTAVAAIAASLAGGADIAVATDLANIAAAVTVAKLQTTGTATPDEIRAIGPKPDYIYEPDLARDLGRARYFNGSEIEIIRDLPDRLNIRHAIFDHDGTISTLRQGWERIMEQVMVRAIVGPRDGDATLRDRIVEHVRQFIDRTTGVQTLVQMQGLVTLVEQFGFVPADQVLDMHGYKAQFKEAIGQLDRQRNEALAGGEWHPQDFLIDNVVAMLEQLRGRGVKLYLTSGSDEPDVKADAATLGYAHLFDGRIFGAVGDVNVEAKRIIMDQIVARHALGGDHFVTFGDGPVEIRQTHKRGGIAVGIASDEARRRGLNPTKRTRLIRAGADLIAPDFGQMQPLLRLLKLE